MALKAMFIVMAMNIAVYVRLLALDLSSYISSVFQLSTLAFLSTSYSSLFEETPDVYKLFVDLLQVE